MTSLAARLIALQLAWAIPAAVAMEIRIAVGSIDVPPWLGERLSMELVRQADGRIDFEARAEALHRSGRPILPPLRLVCRGLVVAVQHLECPEGIVEGITPAKGGKPFSGQWQGQWIGDQWRLQLQLSHAQVAQILAWGKPFSGPLQSLTDVSGTLDLHVELAGTAHALTHLHMTGAVNQLNFNGPSAAEKAAGAFQLIAERHEGIWNAKGNIHLTRGQLYLEPGLTLREIPLGFIFSAPPGGLSLMGDVRWNEQSGAWDIASLRFLHPEVADLRLSGSVRPGQTMRWSGEVEANLADLGKAYGPYLQPLLLTTGWGDLETAGAVEATLNIQENRLTGIHLGFREFYLDDQDGRIAIADLNGNLGITSAAVPVASHLRWAGGGLYRLDIGAGDVALTSRDNNLWLDGKTRLSILDGALAIDSLRLDGVGREDFSARLDARLTPLSFMDFSHAMGWPAMSGTLSGIVPGVLYQHGSLRVGGTLLIQAFDGRIVVQDLRIERLFGPVPTLDANVLLKDLDLESLTGAFSFGKIQGRLNGHMNRLRLEDWQPVAFNAEFATPEEDDKPHRISQRAVENLTSLGGGMTVGAASRMLLRIFDEFSYDRLGLTCHLRDGVCAMDGVAPAEDGGYAIVTPGLLPPWIEVKGFSRRVDWAVLVGRLKEATRSEGPNIE